MKRLLALLAPLFCLSLAGCLTPVSSQSERTNRLLNPPSLYGEREYEIIDVLRSGEEGRALTPDMLRQESVMRVCMATRTTPAAPALDRTFLAYCGRSAQATLERSTVASLQSAAIAPGVKQEDAAPVAPVTSSPNPRTPESEVARDYFDAGVAMSNAICQRYLSDMSLRGVSFSAYDQYLSATGAALTTILPATDTPARAIEVTGSMIGWLGGISRSSRDLYAFDTVSQDIYNLVNTYRERMLPRYYGNPPETFWQALNALDRYHSTCSYISIRTLIRDAVTSRTRQYQNETETGAAGTPVSIPAAFKQALAGALGVQSLTDDQAIAVVLHVMRSDITRAANPAYDKTLGTNVTRAGGAITLATSLSTPPSGQTAVDVQRRLAAIIALSAEGRRIAEQPDGTFSAEATAPEGNPPGQVPNAVTPRAADPAGLDGG
jgi:hypothetical protein